MQGDAVASDNSPMSPSVFTSVRRAALTALILPLLLFGPAPALARTHSHPHKAVAAKTKARARAKTKAKAKAKARPKTRPKTKRKAKVSSSTTAKQPLDCIYAAQHVNTLRAVDAMVGHNFNCEMVYESSAQTWSDWVDPWYINDGDQNVNWADWVKAQPGRTLIITLNLFPASVQNTDWRDAGAAGLYAGYAAQLGENLVQAGLGNSIIRIANEANGTWFADNIGNTPTQYAEWVQFWRDTAIAMRSAPRSNFKFDWNVDAGYRNIPLSDFYPGDDVVDYIGVDSYDSGVPAGVSNRWNYLYNEPDGLGQVLAFAEAHGKPFSIPEWGVNPTTVNDGGGDDPAYVNGIAHLVQSNDVAYQSYFFNESWAQGLASYPNSQAAYIAAFGNADAITGSPAAALSTLPTDPGQAPYGLL
jgi:hypothetical protein